MKLLFLDLETTGLDNTKCGIVQISGIIEVDGKVVDKFNLRVAPFLVDEIQEKAMYIIDKTEDEVRAYPDAGEVHKELREILDRHVDKFNKNDKYYMVGQNVKFDYDFLNAWFRKNNDKYLFGLIFFYLVDLIGLTTAFKIAGKIDIDNMKLKTLAESFNMELDAHDAMSDIVVTREIFHKYVDAIKKTSL